MINVNCESCKFWLRIEKTEIGHCRRYPPTVDTHLVPRQTNKIISGSKQIGLEPIEIVTWPRTKDTEFCGEYHNA